MEQIKTRVHSVGSWLQSNADRLPAILAFLIALTFPTILIAVEFKWLVENKLLILEGVLGRALLALLAFALLFAFGNTTVGKSKSPVGTLGWWRDWFGALFQGLATEFLGAIVTFILLGVAVDIVQARLTEQREVSNLIVEMGSSDNDTAIAALEKLRNLEALTNGSLSGESFPYANLKEAPLQEAVLVDTGFWVANLEGAFFFGADLRGADFSRACLRGAVLGGADLRGANLHLADLKGASFVVSPDITEMLDSDTDVSLIAAEFDEDTILPDGTPWEPSADLQRFTDPGHEKFWRSDVPQSPAFSDYENLSECPSFDVLQATGASE